MITCIFVVNSQLEVCEIVFSTFHKTFDKYQLSVEIYIEQLVAYAHKKWT